MRLPLPIAALLVALPYGVPAAQADGTFQCDDGTVVEFREATKEAVIKGATGSFEAVLPFAGAMGRFATWSPRGQEAVGERVAPFVEYWQPKVGPAVVTYGLVAGQEIECSQR